jgi:hypothetical protein
VIIMSIQHVQYTGIIQSGPQESSPPPFCTVNHYVTSGIPQHD